MMGNALVILLYLWIENEKCKENHVATFAHTTESIYCIKCGYKYCGYLYPHCPNTLYSPNPIKIITGTFRNTTNPLKLLLNLHISQTQVYPLIKTANYYYNKNC